MSHVLINKLTTKPGKREEVIEILIKAGKPFDHNPSCLMYLISAAADDPDVIWVQDVWTDKADHQAALETEDMKRYVKQAVPLLQNMPEQFEVKPAGGKAPWMLF